MVKLEVLKQLEKESSIDLNYVDYIADKDDQEELIRTRLVKSRVDGKYYFHQMEKGEVIKCFEIAFSWKPFDGIYIFCFTPDDLHTYEIDSRNPDKFDVYKLDENQIVENMTCSYDGMTVEYVNENELKFNGKSVAVVDDRDYVYRVLKTKIRANGGAKGLYIFLENIAEKSKVGYPLFASAWREFKERFTE